MQKIFSTEIAGYEISVRLLQNNKFEVRYGADCRTNLDVLDAPLHLGSCIFHVLALEGKYDTLYDEEGEPANG